MTLYPLSAVPPSPAGTDRDALRITSRAAEVVPATRSTRLADVAVAIPVVLASLALGAIVVVAVRGVTPVGPVTLDPLGVSMALLVGVVGMVSAFYARRYLHGEAHRNRFLLQLAVTVAVAFVLMLATHLLLLVAAWTLTSIGLHKLLTHYGERAEAIRAARKKFIISRIGDVALFGVVATVWTYWGSFDLNQVATHANSAGATLIALLVMLAALTKSAQFPFHSWLPETLEAPTPVSALMHAGIINAGGVLLMRFAPLIVQTPAALLTLVTIGTITLSLGLMSMWAQVKIKRTLAWSTVAQMGFMMLQCGLGAFASALLHVLAHGCYKAWNFLSCGEVRSAAAPPPASPARRLTLVATGAAVAAAAMIPASLLTGWSPLHAPGEAALAAILAIAIGQGWAAGMSAKRAATPRRAIVATLLTLAAVTLAFMLYRGASVALLATIGPVAAPAGISALVAAAVPVIAIIVLTVLHAHLPTLGRNAWGRRLRVHALHGFYFGAVADRAVAKMYGVVK